MITEKVANTRARSGPLANLASAVFLSESEEKEIDLLCKVARANGDQLSVSEIIELGDFASTPAELESAWRSSAFLNSKYQIVRGLIVERHFGSDDADLSRDKELRRQRAAEYVHFARRFASFFVRDRGVKMIAVSGSASYKTASVRDDLDFFSITESESLWIFLSKALLLARVFRLARKAVPPLCFSYTVTEQNAERAFLTTRDGLFARDALMTEVITGKRYFQKLLNANAWIREYYPVLYDRRAAALAPDETADEPSESAARVIRRILNLFLYATVGNYVKLKAFLLNRQFSKHHQTAKMFKAEIGEDQHLFESYRYTALRQAYRRELDGSLLSEMMIRTDINIVS